MLECILKVSDLSVLSSVQSVKQVPKHPLLSSPLLSPIDVDAHARVPGSFSRSLIATHEIPACNNYQRMHASTTSCSRCILPCLRTFARLSFAFGGSQGFVARLPQHRLLQVGLDCRAFEREVEFSDTHAAQHFEPR
jgi:hypothetical protein